VLLVERGRRRRKKKKLGKEGEKAEASEEGGGRRRRRRSSLGRRARRREHLKELGKTMIQTVKWMEHTQVFLLFVRGCLFLRGFGLVETQRRT
jgi:hypothetical protein